MIFEAASFFLFVLNIWLSIRSPEEMYNPFSSAEG